MKQETPLVLTTQAKIVQLLFVPDDSKWGCMLLGLGDDGVTYECNNRGLWAPFIPPLGWDREKSIVKTVESIM